MSEFLVTLLEDGSVTVSWCTASGSRESVSLLDGSLAADVLASAMASIVDGSR